MEKKKKEGCVFDLSSRAFAFAFAICGLKMNSWSLGGPLRSYRSNDCALGHINEFIFQVLFQRMKRCNFSA